MDSVALNNFHRFEMEYIDIFKKILWTLKLILV